MGYRTKKTKSSVFFFFFRLSGFFVFTRLFRSFSGFKARLPTTVYPMDRVAATRNRSAQINGSKPTERSRLPLSLPLSYPSPTRIITFPVFSRALCPQQSHAQSPASHTSHQSPASQQQQPAEPAARAQRQSQPTTCQTQQQTRGLQPTSIGHDGAQWHAG